MKAEANIIKGKGNTIADTAIIKLGENAKLIIGDFNYIGEQVCIEVADNASIVIGDCNRIGKNAKFLVDKNGMTIGDWNVLHDNMLIMGGKGLSIGHNGWFGQNTILDGSGKLIIGNGARVGMYSQIWTHVASGEQIEGCQLFGDSPTELKDDVWLVGSCFVGSGVTIGKKTICLAGSNITKNTDEKSVYAGMPAKKMEKLNFWKEVTINQKLKMLLSWLQNEDFLAQNNIDFQLINIANGQFISLTRNNQKAIFGEKPENHFEHSNALFCLSTKRYNKTKSELERIVYKYLYGNKARFLPGLIT